MERRISLAASRLFFVGAALLSGACAPSGDQISDEALRAFCQQSSTSEPLTVLSIPFGETSVDQPYAPYSSIAVRDANGKQTQIDFDPYFDVAPNLSPDQSRIAFARFGPDVSNNHENYNQSSTAEGIYIMAPNGTLRQRLTTGHDEIPTFSPRSNLIAFVRYNNQDPHKNALFVMKSDGTDQQQLTFDTDPIEDIGDPQFSPDQTQIAFEGSKATYAIGVDGKNLVELSNHSDADPFNHDKSVRWINNDELIVERVTGTNQGDLSEHSILVSSRGLPERDVSNICTPNQIS